MNLDVVAVKSLTNGGIGIFSTMIILKSAYIFVEMVTDIRLEMNNLDTMPFFVLKDIHKGRVNNGLKR